MLRQVERYGLQLQQQRTEILVYFNNNKIEEEERDFSFFIGFLYTLLLWFESVVIFYQL